MNDDEQKIQFQCTDCGALKVIKEHDGEDENEFICDECGGTVEAVVVTDEDVVAVVEKIPDEPKTEMEDLQDKTGDSEVEFTDAAQQPFDMSEADEIDEEIEDIDLEGEEEEEVEIASIVIEPDAEEESLEDIEPGLYDEEEEVDEFGYEVEDE